MLSTQARNAISAITHVSHFLRAVSPKTISSGYTGHGNSKLQVVIYELDDLSSRPQNLSEHARVVMADVSSPPDRFQPIKLTRFPQNGGSDDNDEQPDHQPSDEGHDGNGSSDEGRDGDGSSDEGRDGDG